MLFSATLPRRVHELAYEHMNSPAEIEIEPEQVTAERVEETLYHVAVEEKISLLLGLLKQADGGRALVFTNTKRAAERVTAYLMGNGHDTALLSGDIPQKKRQHLLERFKAGKVPILVATDVAARGLHIPEVAYVINFDLPQDAEDYVHRIGRTARAGAAGIALSLACDEYVYSLPEIEAFIGHKITVAPISEELLTEPKPPARRERSSRPVDRNARGKGGRSASRKPRPAGNNAEARNSRDGNASREKQPSDGAQKSADAATPAASQPSKRRRVRRRRRASGAEATEPG
jgi:ATP-dependent RNA helicase RhlB